MDGRKPDKEHLDRILDMLGLKERRNHLPSQMSGGQQQRVSIGRAIFTSPQVILADEPTGNLDSKNSAEIMGLFRRSNRELKQTIIITHGENIAEQCDRIIVLIDGIGDGAHLFKLQIFCIFFIFVVLIAFALRLIIDTAFEVSSKERERHYGVLQSIGATPEQIVRIIAYEGLRLCAVGVIWGFLSAYGVGMRIIKKSPMEAIITRTDKVEKVRKRTLSGLLFGALETYQDIEDEWYGDNIHGISTAFSYNCNGDYNDADHKKAMDWFKKYSDIVSIEDIILISA